MNVMKRAHQLATKRHNAKLLNGIKPAAYKVLFAVALKDAHKEYKAMQSQKPELTIKLAVVGITLAVELDATWFSLEGTATDSEGNKISIGEGGAYSSKVQKDAEWYFCPSNGFTNIELYACRWDYKNDKESFKIIR